MPARLLTAGVLLMGSAVVAAPDITGTWSGGRYLLTITQSGARLETDCALAEFDAPRPDNAGRFDVKGVHRADTGGPQPAGDRPPPGKAARLSGSLEDNRLEATLSVEGAQPQPLTLARGNRVKLIRCL